MFWLMNLVLYFAAGSAVSFEFSLIELLQYNSNS